MNKFIVTSAIALLFVGGVAFTPVQSHAQTPSIAEQIEALLAQVAELQKELAKLRGDVRELIKDGIKEGMTDEDIAKIQELLASDPAIYPEGLVTGYFGPLTKAALKRFQERHGANPTGEIDGVTKDFLEEYLSHGFGDKIPPGLLRAPGIIKKVKDGVCDGTHRGTGPLCKMYKGDDDDHDEHEDEDDHEHDDDFDVELEIEDGDTTLEFTFDGDDYELEIDSTNLNDILEAVAEELDENDVDDLDEELVDAIEHALGEAKDDEDEDIENAENAINDAQDAINDAQDAINDADGDTTDAENLLDDANDKLDEAEDAFDDEDYEEAEELAEEAEDLAKDAEDAL